MSIIPQATIHNALATATTPQETMKVEAMSSAAIAYAKEQNNYELFMDAWRVYLMARRKTTELVKAGNNDVTGIQFTKMQWSRRLRELEVEQEKIDNYFDELVSNGWQPSIAGMLRHSSGGEIDHFAVAVSDLTRGANKLDAEHMDKLTSGQRAAVAHVRKEFGNE